MASAELSHSRVNSPIDLIEQIASSNDWATDRASDDELTLIVAGQWTDYNVSLNWRGDLETLHIACAFDAKIPDNRQNEVYRLVAQINEQLWLGHFDVWLQEGLIMFRHGLMLNGALATTGQCEALLKAALEACERYYQAFQFVVWAGKESRDALASTMFETEGRA
ncbi:MAG TPA: YbjN domain-containing protein [Hyphomicrobiaceae bacterium]|jgi:hypothetical protein|nr:YbjN domain-containing protein [Hyphomicrobiaceae bacterium]